MRKRLRILRGRQGMTLIEIVAGMLLFTIIAVSITAVFVPLLRLYDRSNELAEINTLLDNLSDELLNDLSTAKEISVNGSRITVVNVFGSTDYDVYPLTGEDADKQGTLCRTHDVPVLDQGYYKGKSVQLAYLTRGSTESNEIVLPDGRVTERFYVKLTILDKAEVAGVAGPVLASRTYAVNPLFMGS